MTDGNGGVLSRQRPPNRRLWHRLFTIWAAARHLTRYEQAVWATAAAGGDIVTTCAIVGGITAAGLVTATCPAHG